MIYIHILHSSVDRKCVVYKKVGIACGMNAHGHLHVSTQHRHTSRCLARCKLQEEGEEEFRVNIRLLHRLSFNYAVSVTSLLYSSLTVELMSLCSKIDFLSQLSLWWGQRIDIGIASPVTCGNNVPLKPVKLILNLCAVLLYSHKLC